MTKIAICIDSTPKMTEKDTKEYNISVIPLTVIYSENEQYLDGVELSTEEFYRKLKVDKKIATTTQPSPGQLEECFKELSKDYDEIIYITISSKLSGAYQSAAALAPSFEEQLGMKIHVFDSQYTAGIGVDLAIQASKMANQGISSDEILKRLEVLREQSQLYVIVDDLSHISRTGRIGKAGALLGNALKIKPILKVIDGEVTLFKKQRTLKKTILHTIDVLKENYSKTLSISIIDGDSKELCDFAYDEIIKFANPEQIRRLDASPVIGVHTGCNALSICWMDLK